MNSSQLRISTRLSVVLGFLVSLIVAVAILGVVKMQAIEATSIEITANWLPSVETVNQMDAKAGEFRNLEFAHVLNTDEKAKAGIEKGLVEVGSAFDKLDASYRDLISSPEERALYDEFVKIWKAYQGAHQDVLTLSRQNQNDQARVLLEGQALQHYMAAGAQLDKLVKLNHDGAMSATAVSKATFETARLLLGGAALAALVLAVVVGRWLVTSITRPLGLAVDAANRVADGDLTGRIETGSTDETGQLLQALARMQDSLVHTVSDVRANAESVATASAQIAQGNGDLSQRTEQQAAALEETAATMDQLGATVRNNADNARQANQLALGASTVAQRGGEVVGQVVDTMKGINTSSRRIADIIATIDGIAFQTNILALNAAVEAARAGEQGRGFAVVASEVRNLAQRSADAAKEIKSLITASVEQVEQGTGLVDRAGETMTEIVGAIQRVTDIVAEISSASTEQSEGVGQVGQAITQMDQAVQQNAALVEESAAAAESLKTQARALVEAVAVFRLGQEAHRASAPQPLVERRGPNRATNVTRPAFGHSAPALAAPVAAYVPTPAPAPAPAPAMSAAPSPAPAKTGTDDWESF